MVKVTIQGTPEALAQINAQEARTERVASGRAELAIGRVNVAMPEKGAVRAKVGDFSPPIASPTISAPPPAEVHSMTAAAPAAPLAAPLTVPLVAPAAPAAAPTPVAVAPAAPATPATPGVPDFIDPKFASAPNPMEAQARAYAEAQRSMHAATTTPPAVNPQGITGLSPERRAAIAQEYAANNGQLSDANKAALAQAGIDAGMVNEYFEGRAATQREVTRRVYDSIGGEKRVNEVLEYASRAITDPAQRAAIQAALGRTEAEAIATLKGLDAQAKQAAGMQGSLMAPGASAPGQSDTYPTQADYFAEMRKPEWSDPINQQKCIAKMNRSLPIWKGAR